MVDGGCDVDDVLVFVVVVVVVFVLLWELVEKFWYDELFRVLVVVVDIVGVGFIYINYLMFWVFDIDDLYCWMIECGIIMIDII